MGGRGADVMRELFLALSPKAKLRNALHELHQFALAAKAELRHAHSDREAAERAEAALDHLARMAFEALDVS